MHNVSWSISPSFGSLEGELIELLIRQELQGSAINECHYLSQKSTQLPKHPTLSILHELQ